LKGKLKYLLFILTVHISQDILAQEKTVFFEILPGAAYVAPARLLIHQEGYEDLIMKAIYEVRPFSLPPYYSVRAGVNLKNNTSLELELNHLKLYLMNSDPNIGRFSISHGYNQLWLNLRKEWLYFDFRIGAGPVIAHPENTIRGKKLEETGGLFNDGYHLDGITTQLALQKRIFLTHFLYIMAESKLNVSFSRTEVVAGYADVFVYALHVLFGTGLTF